jgi:glutathione S-transferase
VITLFHHAKTRSTRFIFLLEELGVPYQLQRVTTRTREGGSVDPANPHPHGKVPVIVDDGQRVFESPAIALYLTDKFPERGLGPAVHDPGRGAYLSWLSYYTGVLEPAFLCKFINVDVPRSTAGWVPVDEAMAVVCQVLASGPYMLGNQFSAVDVLYGTTFAMFKDSSLMSKSSIIDDYVARIVSRPAFLRSLQLDAG